MRKKKKLGSFRVLTLSLKKWKRKAALPQTSNFTVKGKFLLPKQTFARKRRVFEPGTNLPPVLVHHHLHV